MPAMTTMGPRTAATRNSSPATGIRDLDGHLSPASPNCAGAGEPASWPQRGQNLAEAGTEAEHLLHTTLLISEYIYALKVAVVHYNRPPCLEPSPPRVG